MSKRQPRRSCGYCGKELNRPEKFYCTVACQHLKQFEDYKRSVSLTGCLSPSPVSAKRYLRHIAGNKCSICQLEFWFVKVIPLVLDHIDGNSDNWQVENLRLICPNCDTFTPFYKGRNKGNGRHTRRMRFREGKSY